MIEESRNSDVKVFEDRFKLAEAAADEFAEVAERACFDVLELAVALAGGSTPSLFYSALARRKINWGRVHFYWGDERCVPPDNPESNFRSASRDLLDKIDIPGDNIHRIRGEDDPEREALRYGKEIAGNLAKGGRVFPEFDWIFLGLGSDGHTASLFPGGTLFPSDASLCAVASHPGTGQKRITFTLPLINHARRISFLVTGKEKAVVVSSILGRKEGSRDYPAAWINPVQGTTDWFLDRDSAGLSLE